MERNLFWPCRAASGTFEYSLDIFVLHTQGINSLHTKKEQKKSIFRIEFNYNEQSKRTKKEAPNRLWIEIDEWIRIVLGFVGFFLVFPSISCTLHFHIDGNDFKRYYVIAYKTWLIRYIPVPFAAQMTLPIAFFFFYLEFQFHAFKFRTQFLPFSFCWSFPEIRMNLGTGNILKCWSVYHSPTIKFKWFKKLNTICANVYNLWHTSQLANIHVFERWCAFNWNRTQPASVQ